MTHLSMTELWTTQLRTTQHSCNFLHSIYSTFSHSTLGLFRHFVFRCSVILCSVFWHSVFRCSVLLRWVFQRSDIQCSVFRRSVFRRSVGESNSPLGLGPRPSPSTNLIKIFGQARHQQLSCLLVFSWHWLSAGEHARESRLPSGIGGHRHRSQCRRYPTSDIDICYSDIGDKYVGLKNVIPISEVFRVEPGTVSVRYNTKLLWLPVLTKMSDIGYRIKHYSISDIMLDSALSVWYRKFRYQAQSDIADHGYRTKCPPMPSGEYAEESITATNTDNSSNIRKIENPE